jgi:hypothetical protein
MPDPLQILEAIALAGALAALVLVPFKWWRSPRRAPADVGEVVGIGAGFALGCGWLAVRLHWPPREDVDRLLLILLPAASAVEIVIAFVGRRAWIGWLLRFVIGAAAAPILLYGSIYLADAAGPGTREWAPAYAMVILLALAAALAANWGFLALLVQRASSRSVAIAVAIACTGAAVTIMLSGYATGGQIGLPLAAALAGVTVASLRLTGGATSDGALSVGIVGLFGLVVMGFYFGALRFGLACLLFFAPLLAWLSELPYISRLNRKLLAFGRIVLIGAAVGAAVAIAARDFARESSQGTPSPGEPSIQDYMDFGK